MARDISYEEAREEKVYELTEPHYVRLLAQLRGGNADLISSIDEAVFASLPDSFWREIVLSAAHGHALSIGARIVKLVENAVLAQAEIEAIKEVEQIEREAA